MKIGIVGDVHFCQYGSIIRGRGKLFSKRLENCIDSLNWAEQLFKENGCQLISYCGDFFDRPDINAEELSALRSIKWVDTIPHTFIVGNHELGTNDLAFNSANALAFTVFDTPTKIDIANIEICFLPYILESNKKPLVEYFGDKPLNKKRLIISHNDLAGIQMGSFISKSGFNIDEITACCDKYINGHLHNGEQITSKIFNIGILSGLNFSGDASKYDHHIFILDTDTFAIDVFENPYAFNFYKFDTLQENVDFKKLKSNAVISLKTSCSKAEKYKEKLAKAKNIIDSRVIIQFDKATDMVPLNEGLEDLSVDHLAEFKKFITDTLGTDPIVLEELNQVCK